MECINCGAPGGLTKLYDVITSEGIVKLCKKCLNEENAPIIRKPTETQIQSVTKNESLYKRLSDAAGINPEEHKINVQRFQKEDILKKQEVTLRDLVDQKFDKFVKKTTKKRDDLIDNFHWIIMRSRRAKKLTVTQLAQQVGESERVIKMAEQGNLPEGNYKLVQRLEECLGIRILKQEVADELERRKKQLGFDKYSTENLTISDLQEIKKDNPPLKQNKKEPYWKRFISRLISKKEDIPGEEIRSMIEKEEISASEDSKSDFEFEDTRGVPIEFDDTTLEISENLAEEEKKDDDLSQGDIDDIVFGRK